jgi:hypothetical protein
MRIMSDNVASGASRRISVHWLRVAFLVLAIGYAVPIATAAFERLTAVNQAAKERLIREHRLWELEPNFRGKPEIWTRMASRLLNDRQLLARVAARHGVEAGPLELEYRRDLGIARGEVVLSACAAWSAPLLALYGIAWVFRRRKPAPPARLPPASASDPRYLPPGPG